jgi:lipopolysaccharide export system protein LptA
MTRLTGGFGALLVSALVAASHAASAQPLDLSQGGPITITARDGLEWHQAQQEVIALGDARAVRQNVTVTADRLIAFYRKKAEPNASQPGTPQPGTPQPGISTQGSTQGHLTAGQPGTGQPGTGQPGTGQPGAGQPVAAHPAAAQTGLAAADAEDNGGTEIYRLRAEGNVHIFTATDHAQGDAAVYDIDQAVMVMTGHNLRLTTPNDVLTSRDTMEYWPQKHMAVARGNAVVVTKDARRVAADVLVAYTTPTATPGTPGAASGPAKPPSKPTPASSPPGSHPAGSGDDLQSSGKLEKVEAFGHVSVRTPTDTAIGERAVYVPDTGIARLAGNVRITRGQNQLDGQEAEVNMNTGIARLLRSDAERVTGLMVPNDASNRDLSNLGNQPPATVGQAGTQTGTQPGTHPGNQSGAQSGNASASQPGNPPADLLASPPSTTNPTGGHP